MWYIVSASNLAGTELNIYTSTAQPTIRTWGGCWRFNRRKVGVYSLLDYYISYIEPFVTEDFNELVDKYPLLAIKLM